MIVVGEFLWRNRIEGHTVFMGDEYSVLFLQIDALDHILGVVEFELF